MVILVVQEGGERSVGLRDRAEGGREDEVGSIGMKRQ